MKIIFAKRADGLASLRCVRNDGSETWSSTKQPAMVIHDLIHYVVETELGLHRAFYGLVAEGYDISSFSQPGSQRPEALQPARLPKEAHQAEILVGLLQTERSDGVEYPRFAATLVKVCILKNVPPPSLSDTTLDNIRTRTTQLWHQWQALTEEETLSLEFNPDSFTH